MYIKRQGQKGRHSTYVRSYSLDRFNKIDRNRWRCATSALYCRLANRRSFQNVKKCLWAALITRTYPRTCLVTLQNTHVQILKLRFKLLGILQFSLRYFPFGAISVETL